ncbi:uncharacterized protein LOC122947448 [Acropora millepora]|uniref:uncharacterized protein LOC122947448 n=1 Tax=Acropora millepora TaxID=45264 RepID=UPI001CF4C985|nr:uncharacterized protein LOC122947448 [Acropora millepora]
MVLKTIQPKKISMKGKGCGCSGKCRTRICPCRNTQKTCSVDCNCQSPKCENRQFASPVKKIKNCPEVNEVFDDETLLKSCQKEIYELRKQLTDGNNQVNFTSLLMFEFASPVKKIKNCPEVNEVRPNWI